MSGQSNDFGFWFYCTHFKTDSLQPDQEMALDSALSVSSPLIDCERTLGLLLGLYACHLAHSTPVTAEEEENEKWLTSDFFSGGMETFVEPVDNVRRSVMVVVAYQRARWLRLALLDFHTFYFLLCPSSFVYCPWFY